MRRGERKPRIARKLFDLFFLNQGDLEIRLLRIRRERTGSNKIAITFKPSSRHSPHRGSARHWARWSLRNQDLLNRWHFFWLLAILPDERPPTRITSDDRLASRHFDL